MRPYNFGAGPAMLPESVLQTAKDELFDWRGQGMSVLEIGHRTRAFQELLEELESDLRELMMIPKDYHVLFLGGPARSQFSMIPLNLLPYHMKAAYLISGLWSSLAFAEASQLKQAYCLASSENEGFIEAPDFDAHEFQAKTAYLYYTPNETVNGVRFSKTPKSPNMPLIADMTSCILTEPFDVSDFGLIFAGTQKNLGIAGMTVVIIRPDLMFKNEDMPLPVMWDYQTHIDNKSSYATPPVFSIYIAANMLQWMKAQGGVQTIYELNLKKSTLLYSYIDTSPCYQCLVKPNSRSIVNVSFRLTNRALEDKFLVQAQQEGLLALQGHRTVGGIRASLYNAMPLDGVIALIDFMDVFSKAHQ